MEKSWTRKRRASNLPDHRNKASERGKVQDHFTFTTKQRRVFVEAGTKTEAGELTVWSWGGRHNKVVITCSRMLTLSG